MGIYRRKGAFQERLERASSALAARGVPADALTLAGLVTALAAAAALLLSGDQRLLLALVPPLVLGRLMLNILDGQVARRGGKARPWGEVLNEFSDRLADVAIFASLSFVEGVVSPLGLWVTIMILLSSYLDILGKAASGRRTYAGMMGKGDRMILLAAFALAGLLFDPGAVFNLCLLIVGAGVLLTILQRWEAIRRDLQQPPR